MIEKFYGEHLIDKYLRETFFPDYSYNGVFVEVGGGTPELISVSKHFKDNGWRTIIIEPNPVFAQLHREAGNEIYQVACSFENRSNVSFNCVSINKDLAKEITYQSFSSLGPKMEHIGNNLDYYNQLTKMEIFVDTKTLDSIIEEAGNPKIDILSIDVEGWEKEVLDGMTIVPQIVMLENVQNNDKYIQEMSIRGYSFICKRGLDEIYEKK